MRLSSEKIRITFKNLAGRASFPSFRLAEKILPPPALYRVLHLFFFGRAALNSLFKKPASLPALPDFLQTPDTLMVRIQRRQNAYLNRLLEYFPDRLSRDGWLDRCQIDGLRHLQTARASGRPVVLAFCHFGPYYLLRSWLRAAGFPAGIMLAGPASTRPRLRRFQDRFSRRPEIPVVLYQDQWRELTAFLGAGHPLLVAIDVPRGKQMNFPCAKGWDFQMATGAVRLARHHHATLIPCSIIDRGSWNFQIQLGTPVPPEYLTADHDSSRAGNHLLHELFPHFRAWPDQCTDYLRQCLKTATPIPAPQLNSCPH